MYLIVCYGKEDDFADIAFRFNDMIGDDKR